ncbi:uncharacterized protein LOC126885096 isoform X1 [Diabrotica virgifera virgifera]|uniref:Uncharacterized protein n=1 Tax=Diabrotica virgifera virgifera TaxID=50390 RepID=A0ABM5KBB7_DIAVI|nr:uncharacterized protein LOC126885096 isoform X1 [Diabrotica virgifera virgifera]
MVMGQFVTTYRKDYLWPYVKTLGLRPEPEHIYSPQYQDQIYCKCHCLPALPATSQQRTLIGPEALHDEEWSRLGPMGPLLEPKVFTAKVSAAPESEISRFNQPNVFMAKIKEKYPFIYECLRTAPPDDLIARINKDRLASSYQVDYCHKQEYPNAPYDELIRAAGVEGLRPCPEPVRLPGDVCRPIPKMKGYGRNGAFTSEEFGRRQGGGSSRGGFIKEDLKQVLGACKGGTFTITPGYTEYMDTFSRLGTLIIRDGLHDPVRRSKRPIF